LRTKHKAPRAEGPKLLVRKGGLEPPRIAPPDPKSGETRLYLVCFIQLTNIDICWSPF